MFVKWLVGREIDSKEDELADHEERLRRLEDSRVTRNDMDELRLSLMASIANMGERAEKISNQRHEENRETLSHVLQRVDSLWDRRRIERGD